MLSMRSRYGPSVTRGPGGGRSWSVSWPACAGRPWARSRCRGAVYRAGPGVSSVVRFLRSGRSASRRHLEAIDVSDEVNNPLVALNCIVCAALLDDPAHLIRTGLQRLFAGEDIGEHPADGVDLVEDGIVLKVTE